MAPSLVDGDITVLFGCPAFLKQGVIMVKVSRPCNVIWLAKKSCGGWGVRSSHHGCKLNPGHTGKHVCACSQTTTNSEETDTS